MICTECRAGSHVWCRGCPCQHRPMVDVHGLARQASSQSALAALLTPTLSAQEAQR